MKRIEQIDGLRGFALFGIIMTHMFEGYVASMIPPQYADFNILYPIDSISKTIISSLFIGKFYAIFSMLFGLSFYLILDQRAGASSLKFAWRLVLLFAIGYIHHIHYRGDFLTVYAVIGLPLILFRKLPDKMILILGLVLAFNVPMMVTRLLPIVAPPPQQTQQTIQTTVAEPVIAEPQNNPFVAAGIYFDLILKGDYVGLIKSNSTIGFANKLNYLRFSGRIFLIPGLFLLGLWVGRKKWPEKIDELPLAPLIKWSALIGIPLTIAHYYLIQPDNTPLLNYLGAVAGDASNMFMPFLYICLVLLLFKTNATKSIVSQLIPVGKMGLTNYVLQSAFGLFIFYGYGLGLLIKLSGTIALALAMLFFIFQIIFSKWWLSKFKYGPLEWLWRSGTNGSWQSMKR